MLFLGTGASDVIPNTFCCCPICADARKHPERARLRSMLLLDEDTLIDFGPDLAAAAIKNNADLTKVSTVFITHTHEDHFCPSNVGLYRMSVTRPQQPLNFYLSEEALATVAAIYKPSLYIDCGLDEVKGYKNEDIMLHTMPLEKAIEYRNYTVEAVQTTHRASSMEMGINYLFTRNDGRKMLYATDTGMYTARALDYLQNRKIDTFIMEATFGSYKDNDIHLHLNVYAFVDMLNIMLDRGIITAATRVYATHINHKHSFKHDQMQDWFNNNAPVPVTVAADGMEAAF